MFLLFQLLNFEPLLLFFVSNSLEFGNFSFLFLFLSFSESSLCFLILFLSPLFLFSQLLLGYFLEFCLCFLFLLLDFSKTFLFCKSLFFFLLFQPFFDSCHLFLGLFLNSFKLKTSFFFCLGLHFLEFFFLFLFSSLLLQYFSLVFLLFLLDLNLDHFLFEFLSYLLGMQLQLRLFFTLFLLFSLQLSFTFFRFFLLLLDPQSLSRPLLSLQFLSLLLFLLLSNPFLLFFLGPLFFLELASQFFFRLYFLLFYFLSLLFQLYHLFLFSALFFCLAFQFFYFLMLPSGSFWFALDGAPFVSFEEFLGIGCALDIVVGIGSQKWHFPLLKLHIEQFQLLLTGELNHDLISFLELGDPTNCVLLEGCSDLLF